VKTKADVFRERGKCECGCGRARCFTVESGIGGIGICVGALVGVGHSESISGPVVHDVVDRIQKNRATPAEPEQDSDEAWLRLVVFGLTGVECRVQMRPGGDAWVQSDGQADVFVLTARELKAETRGRNAAEVSYCLSQFGWPLKSAIPTPPPSPAQPVGEPEKRFGVCSHCGAKVGVACNCCEYCIRRVSSNLNDAESTRKTSEHPGHIAAAARLAALEKRSRPRRTKWQRELEVEHPWDADDSLVGD